MKFLELPQVYSFNNLLGNLVTPDGSRLQIRLEVYTCTTTLMMTPFTNIFSGKAAGNDKRLLKQLETKFNIVKDHNSTITDSEDNEPTFNNNSTSNINTTTTTSPTNGSSTILNLTNGISLKNFYYLISTMNNMFPDYDFSDIPAEAFHRIYSLSSLISHFNTSIFNTGINSNISSFADFTRQMWDCMDEAVGGLEESEIFSFDPATESYEVDDPFRERGTM